MAMVRTLYEFAWVCRGVVVSLFPTPWLVFTRPFQTWNFNVHGPPAIIAGTGETVKVMVPAVVVDARL